MPATHVLVSNPGNPGDLATAVQLNGSKGKQLAVPLVLRTKLPSWGGSFAGTLTGGNGRGGGPAQTNVYRFDVPRGQHDLGIDVTLAGDPNQVINGTANIGLVAHTQLFDPAVTSSTGNAWLGTVRANAPAVTPLVLQPGQSGTISVTVTPTAPKGTKVSGLLYLDDYNQFANAGDSLKAFPYSYTVG